MKNILFYNLWHNGDVFSGRGYIQRIMDAIPDAKFGYYHKNHPKIVSDLTKITFEPDLNKLQVDMLNYRKIFETDKTIYINTWVGTYFSQHQSRMIDFPSAIFNLPGEEHANYRSLHQIYKFIVNYLNSYHSCKIQLPENPLDCVPTIKWDKYHISPVQEVVKQNKRMYLFCNGQVRSSQASLTNMQNVISTLASIYPQDLFICTEKFDTSLENILFTDDIFHLENDLNEIAYLSTHCSTIIGKNSGPFMFTHVKDNINNPNTTFVAFSNRVSDCYPHHMRNLPCNYLFSNATHDPAVIKTILAAFSLQRRAIVSL